MSLHSSPQELAAFLATVLENLSEGVVACDANGILTTFNRATRMFHGLPEEALPSEMWAEYYHLFRADGVTPLEMTEVPLYRALAGEVVRNVEMVIAAGGVQRTVLCNGQAIFDASGKKLGAVVAMHEVTDLKRAAADLKAEKRFRTLFEQSPLSVQLLSADGRTLQVNSAWKKLWGMPDDFVENYILKDYNLLKDEQLAVRGILPIIQEGFAGRGGKIPAIYYDTKALSAGLEHGRWVEGFIEPILDDKGSVREVVLIHRDVTEQKEFESQLKAAKDAAEQANGLKTAFLANMSHEIRTPLGAILGFSELLRTSKMVQPEAIELLDIIDRSGKALMQIIDDVLDLSKIEAGRMEIKTTPVHPDGLIAEIVALLSVQARQNKIELLHERQSQPVALFTDPTRVRQILINLIGNAIKFTSGGSVTVSSRAASTEGVFTISVRDTGIGIEKDAQKHLFQPFHQLDGSDKRPFGGTGLGLSLSRRLARAMGGDVYLENSELGRGSVFALSLPLVLAEPSVKTEITSTKDSAAKILALKGVRILLADDSEDNRTLVTIMLERQGARITEAVNGLEAYKMALADDFDLILMDVQMPVMDGIEAIKKLREEHVRTPVIALTAHAMREERDRCLAAGADAHQAKPIAFDQLIQVIARLVQT